MVLERVAVEEIPLRCYGLEYSSRDSRCQACQFAPDCQRVSTVRRGKIPLSQVEVDLLPLELVEIQQKEKDDIDKLYKTLFRLVYKDAEPDSLFRIKQAEQRLRDIADDVGCSVRIYILSCLLARRTLAPDTRFYANFLFAKNSTDLVKQYAELANERYGAFDYEALGKLTEGGDELTKAKTRLRDSEVLCGHWVVGYKLKQTGPVTDLFYAENELRLDPIWLSLEPSYVEFHNRVPARTEAVQRHRMEVRRVRTWLQKKRPVAVTFFECRSKLFLASVSDVLQRYGHTLDDFESPPLIQDAIRFWSRLALALQHIHCLRHAGLLD